MSLCYNQGDAERWALFSGDYNPIHFDLAEAQRLGMEKLCVHGMRAMLDVKATLSAALAEQLPAADGLLFSCRLREPVVCGTHYQLPVVQTIRQQKLQLSGNLLSAETQQVSINSKLSSAQAPVLQPWTEGYALSVDTQAMLYPQFLAVQGRLGPEWSFLDSLLFRQLLDAPATLETVRSILPELDAVVSLRDVFRHVQVVQTHHDTQFIPGLLPCMDENASFSPFEYSILPTLLMGEKETGLILQAGIQAWRGVQPLMKVTVTLKTGPLTAD